MQKVDHSMTCSDSDLHLTERVQRFLSASRERGSNPPPRSFCHDLQKMFQASQNLTWRERQARSWAHALTNQPVFLFSDEHLCGMIYLIGEEEPAPVVDETCEDPFAWSVRAAARVASALPQHQELCDLALFSQNAAPGHVTWRWDWILERGVKGLLDDHQNALAETTDAVAAEYYRCVIILLESMLAWNRRHVMELQKKLSDAVGIEPQRLHMLLELCRQVPEHPARNFHEAVQSFYFQFIYLMRESPYGGNGPGRLDYFLWPFLQRDLESGACSLSRARELIDELFIRIHERVQPSDGHVTAIVVGGCDQEGKAAVNPLTRIMVESIMALKQTHPSVYVRIPHEDAEEAIDISVDYLLHGDNRAQILNDSRIIAAMQSYGMPFADAAMYTCGGCMEIVPQGMGCDLLWTGTHNIPKVLEMCLTGGECLQTGSSLTHVNLPPLSAYSDFEDFYAAFSDELKRQVTLYFRKVDIFSESMADFRPLFLLSSMTEKCLQEGRESQDGGVRHHDYGNTPMGIPNAADSLYAIKKAVFEDNFCTAAELVNALKSNFAGCENLRRRLRSLPKYGQQNHDADDMTDRLLGTICEIYAAQRTRFGGRVKPIIFTFLWASSAGAVLGATADGQLAGQAIAHGLTPQSCGLRKGLGSAIASHAGLSLEKIAGAASTMWDVDPQLATPAIMKQVLTAFINLGGQIFQGNTTNVQELLYAKENPDAYQDLIVRVGGFSGRFVALAPEVQDEVIQRYRHTAT